MVKLGRGLNVLLPVERDGILHVDPQRISPNPDQPRKDFDEESLIQLAASVREKGILQPIIVNRNDDSSFTIIAGERRLRAAVLCGLTKVPCIVRDKKHNDALEISLIENIQRQDLNPIETARAFQKLIDDFELKQEDIATKVGKDRATVANYLRLLHLPQEVQAMVSENKLSMGHARAIVSAGSPVQQLDIAGQVIENNLNVRQTEALVAALSTEVAEKQPPATTATTPAQKDPHISNIEQELIKTLGTKVRINHKGKKGKIEIEYYSLDELNRLIDILRI
ncbi:ParB/RepB/Spo0J family partition protein [Candidatus Magnetobacterium casense]|uniref:ParB/RepB/Spo0J family partition protein n=1 Tax=Candidatus Magnetobacterium casense TaxID=1455061 RepID=A0ABS6RWY1_9BACT|nr:ParB/RepB/Spo0J family partition protein [Candidatus Magnetobacterium casensis]MBV6341136.1 ParB/RepB/Spo0J family partition protein [Candidatus Magnetobacterium casensis]